MTVDVSTRRGLKKPAHASAKTPKRARGRPQRATARALTALGLIVAGLTAIALTGIGTTEHSTPATLTGRSLSEAVLASLRTGDEVVAETAPPPWFEEEFFSTSDYFDFHGNDAETVFGMTSAKPQASTFASLRAAMEAKGWTAVSTGDVATMTMIRTEGEHTWALISGQDVGGQSVIVVQTLPGE